MKNIFFLILYVSMFSFSHSAKEGDLDGAWRAIEAFINGERQEVVDGLMVATEGYMSINWTAADGNKYFNYSSYEFDGGMVNVEIAVRDFNEDKKPKPPFDFCSNFSDEDLLKLRNQVEGRS